MPKFSAFVAHSFEPTDDAIWHKFVDYFNAFRKSTDWFDWEEGRPAESREVGQKVRERIAANPIFIGIFTRKHTLIPKKVASSWRALLLPFQGDSTMLWATSNWVIQESGYALGKEKHLILLVENSIAEMPQLHDNLEYIPFERNSLDGAILKLNEMLLKIGGARNHTGPATETGQPSASVPDSAQEALQPETSDSKPATENKSVISQLSELLLGEAKNLAQAQKVFNEYLATETDAEEKIRTATLYQRFRCVAGEADSMTELQKLTTTSKVYFPWMALGACYRDFEQHDSAADSFIEASNLCQKASLKIDLLCSAAISRAHAKRFVDAYSLIRPLIGRKDIEPTTTAGLYQCFGDIAEIQGDQHWMAIFYEKSLVLFPLNSKLRFKLAYAYSQLKENGLAIFHYSLYLQNTEDAIGFNNLGVAFQEAGLKAKSIGCFEESVKRSETLATANLAQRYLVEGFLSDAKRLIDDARKADNPHPSIGAAMTRLQEISDEEGDKKKALLQKAEAEQQFRTLLAKGLASPPEDTDSFSGTWETKYGDIRIVVTNSRLNGEGQFRMKENGLFAALMLGRQSQPAPDVYKLRTIKLTGEALGTGVRYEFRVTDKRERSSNEDTVFAATGFGLLSQDKQGIQALERNKEGELIEVQMKRKAVL